MVERLAVVGAGPHGLATLAALAARGSWPAHVTVIDPLPGWCWAWDEKLARLAIGHLRSPQVHHPGVRPMELRDLVEQLPSEEQLALRSHEAERVPTPRGMRRLIDQVAAQLGPIERVEGRAVELVQRRDRSVQLTVHEADGTLSDAAYDAVVLAHNPSHPAVPSWAQELVEAGAAAHASTVDLRETEVAQREVLIVGGGHTAGTLAAAVAARGGRPVLITRRPLRARPYDVDASWLGPRRLVDYALAPPDLRREMVDQARDGGTIPPGLLRHLHRLAEAGELTLLEAVDVPATVRARLATGSRGARHAPLLWLATGFSQHIARDPLVAPLLGALRVAVHDGLPEVQERLSLGSSQIFVTGPYAALGVGPACRNLAGARPAAARIAQALAA